MTREEFLKYTYESINSDLKFAETKNTFLTTFNLAVVGATTAFFFGNDNDISNKAYILFVAFTVMILIATLIAISSFLPVNKVGKFLKPKKSEGKRFMFYKYNYSNFKTNVDDFCNEVKNEFDGSDFNSIENQFAGQIVDLSYVAYTKFTIFAIALVFEMVSFPFFIAGILVG